MPRLCSKLEASEKAGKLRLDGSDSTPHKGMLALVVFVRDLPGKKIKVFGENTSHNECGEKPHSLISPQVPIFCPGKIGGGCLCDDRFSHSHL
jgi:hypothetical protein